MTTLGEFARCWGGHTPGLLGAKRSYAVLCPLLEREDGLHILFERRSATVAQGGETCFPGGEMEPGETAEACALRETWEELGIPPEHVTVLGRADFLCSQRGFLMQPVLAGVSAAGFAGMNPSPAEVAEAFTVPVDFFLRTEPELYVYTLEPRVGEGFPYQAVGIPADYRWAGGRVEVPVWYYEGRAIWGMTARILRAILARQRSFGEGAP